MSGNKVAVFGDFKVDDPRSLNLSGELVELLAGCGVSMVNFEAPVEGYGRPIMKSGPCLCQSAYSPDWLEQHGFNAVSLANNHAMDFGPEALDATRKSFREARVMGAGNFREAYSFNEFKVGEYSLGVICATQCEFGTLYDSAASDNSVGCAWIFSREIERLIAEKKDSVDALLLYLHAGIEHLDVPIPEWREAYRRFIDWGADAVVASHPHVPQGWETYRGKPIVYSLGNFCFQTARPPRKLLDHWNESLVCVISLEGKHQVGSSVIPVRYFPETYSLAIEHSEYSMKRLEELNRMLEDEQSYQGIVDKAAHDLFPEYMGLFTRSGLAARPLSKWMVKGLLDRLHLRGRPDMTHAINNIRCESHRWMIQRAISLRYGV